MKTYYAVVAKDGYGNDFVSKYFNTVRAARTWKRWLLSRPMPFQGIWIKNLTTDNEVA